METPLLLEHGLHHLPLTHRAPVWSRVPKGLCTAIYTSLFAGCYSTHRRLHSQLLEGQPY
eukprot:5193587-Amphidinium_carterae.1